MQQQAPDVELRFAELQTQIDRLCVALQRWQQTQERGNPAEERLAELVEQCSATFNRWMTLDARHEQMVAKLEARLNDWKFVESRLEQDSDRRLRQFEEIIEQEGAALRNVHAEPVKQLREQAANLEETCVAAANLALRAFERAEARLSSLEQDLHSRLNQLTHEFQVAIAGVRGEASVHGRSLTSPVSPFPLESVMRIHDQLRRSAEGHANGVSPSPDSSGTSPGGSVSRGLQLPESVGLSDRLETLERAVTSNQEEAKATAERTENMRRVWRMGSLVAGVLVLVALAVGFFLQRRVDTRLTEAAVRVAAAERRADEATRTASQQIAATRDDAQKRIDEARHTAHQAQIVSSVLAAPDLARYNLTGSAVAVRAYAQFLWSRSRGFVFSGSRIPVPPKGTTYQLWLVTSTAPVSGGLFTPDSAGRATLVTDEPPNVPRPVSGVLVTLEPTGGSTAPSGAAFLTRVP